MLAVISAPIGTPRVGCGEEGRFTQHRWCSCEHSRPVEQLSVVAAQLCSSLVAKQHGCAPAGTRPLSSSTALLGSAQPLPHPALLSLLSSAPQVWEGLARRLISDPCYLLEHLGLKGLLPRQLLYLYCNRAKVQLLPPQKLMLRGSC